MTEVTFDVDLYDGAAVAKAVAIYAQVASCTLDQGNQEGSRHRLRVTATGKVPEPRIVDELCNYALGTTIEDRRIRGSTLT